MSRSTAATDRDQQLEMALDALEEITDLYEKAELAFADMDCDFDIAFASAFNAADAKSAEAKTKIAEVATIGIRRQHAQAKAQLSILKGKLRSAQLAVSARQSLLSSSRRTSEAFG